jgi:hypothetical protein
MLFRQIFLVRYIGAGEIVAMIVQAASEKVTTCALKFLVIPFT